MTGRRVGKRIRHQLRRGSKKPREFVRKRSETSAQERYRITQLMVSGAVFVLIVAVKLLFPKQLDMVREPLDRMLDKNMDVAEVFAAVGNVFSGNEWKGDVYQAVFGPQDSVNGIADGDNAENMMSGDVPEIESATSGNYSILYTDTNLPDHVNLQQAVLGFQYCAPVSGSISSYFGYRKNTAGENDRFHYGLDIAADEGAEIVSFADGVVTVTADSSSYGKYIIVAHDNGCTTLYAHCKEIYACSGQTVKRGEKIALVGDSGQATGPHLHFELQQNDVYLNPVYYVL